MMRERADALGATLDLYSHVGEGTVVRIAWREQLVSAQ
jgi:signal transduction histidine kinase